MKCGMNILKRMITMAILLSGCETPIHIEYSVPEPAVVVDGLITDQPGPYEVKLTYTAAYAVNSEGNNRPVTGAMVVIEDDAGNADLLTEYNPGNYITPVGGIQGVVGRSYTLRITLVDGKEIESYPEKLLPVPPIDSLYYDFQPVTPNQLQGHQVYAAVNDPEDEMNYYRWKWQGYYIFYMINEINDVIACFQKEFDINKININSDRYIDGNVLFQPIALIPHFANDYYLIQVFQQSLTGDAYEFWDQVNEQGTQIGSIFDQIPSKIRGNCYYTDDLEETVYGYFGASSIIQKNLMMKFRTGMKPLYPKEYNYHPCSYYPNAFPFDPSYPSTWPEGWVFF
jgi:hypothetical protein